MKRYTTALVATATALMVALSPAVASAGEPNHDAQLTSVASPPGGTSNNKCAGFNTSSSKRHWFNTSSSKTAYGLPDTVIRSALLTWLHLAANATCQGDALLDTNGDSVGDMTLDQAKAAISAAIANGDYNQLCWAYHLAQVVAD